MENDLACDTVHKLKWTISHCNQCVPFYQDLLESIVSDGINISNIFDFYEIPYADYESKDNPFRFLANSIYNMERIIYNLHKKYLLGYSQGDIYCLGKISEKLLSGAGVKRFDTAIVQSGFDGIIYGLKNLETNIIECESTNISGDIIDRSKVIVGNEDFVKSISENIHNDSIIFISNLDFKSKVQTVNPFYKLIDIGFGMGSGIGIVDVKTGLIYFAEDYYFVEWEKSDNAGRSNLIVTTLTMEGTPLLRYRTDLFYDRKNRSICKK